MDMAQLIAAMQQRGQGQVNAMPNQAQALGGRMDSMMRNTPGGPQAGGGQTALTPEIFKAIMMALAQAQQQRPQGQLSGPPPMGGTGR